MRSSRNYHVSIEERIWDGAGTGARAFFIHFGGRFNTVEAELSLPGLMLLNTDSLFCFFFNSSLSLALTQSSLMQIITSMLTVSLYSPETEQKMVGIRSGKTMGEAGGEEGRPHETYGRQGEVSVERANVRRV